MINRIRIWLRKNFFLRKLIGYYLSSSGLLDFYFRSYTVSPSWASRISNVLSSSDNVLIPKVTDAGQIKGGKQVMHNGLKIYLGSYYGPEYAKMLLATKGVHEPQEERVFAEAIKTLPLNAVMIEMGAFWSFYSMWFQKQLPHAINFMIEPDDFNLGQGKRNFKLNGMKGAFTQAFIGKESIDSTPVKTTCIDDFVEKNSINFIHMLHSDIQGFEYDMLQGAQKSILAKRIGYVFISTHSNEVHGECLQFLMSLNFEIIASANLDESYSEDGLIVARAPYMAGIGKIDISKRVVV